MANRALIEKAKRQAKRFQELRKDPRYLKTIGKLKREGLLDVRDTPEYRGQVFLEDALWAAELEPRIYELLPAIILRRPKLFTFLTLPEDLDRVVKELKRGHAKTPYQEIAPDKYSQWVSFVGRKPEAPKVLKAFRLSAEELETLADLAQKTSQSQTQVLRQALLEYAKRLGE